MKIDLNLEKGYCKVTREETDRKYYGAYMAKGESNLLHAIKNELIKQGYDVIKKRMWKDGHFVDDIQQYVRTRSKKSGFMILNASFAIYGADEKFNEGEVIFNVETY